VEPALASLALHKHFTTAYGDVQPGRASCPTIACMEKWSSCHNASNLTLESAISTNEPQSSQYVLSAGFEHSSCSGIDVASFFHTILKPFKALAVNGLAVLSTGYEQCYPQDNRTTQFYQTKLNRLHLQLLIPGRLTAPLRAAGSAGQWQLDERDIPASLRLPVPAGSDAGSGRNRGT